MKNKTVRIAAVADIHCNSTNKDSLRILLTQMAETADVLLFCGDLTDTGQIEEALILSELGKTIKIPMIGVLGNHDFQIDKQDEIKDILHKGNFLLLDGDTITVHNIGFAGVKGFGAGFGKFQLQAWGEKAVKNFVREAIDEELKLESALAHLKESPRVVLMHYSPIRATVEGESPEVFPFLGSTRLEMPIDQYEVAAVFHGHAHYGTPRGRTAGNIPVYNVSLSVLLRVYPNNPPFQIVEIDVNESG